MSRHDDSVSLKDMLSHSLEAVELLGDASREELVSRKSGTPLQKADVTPLRPVQEFYF